MNKFVLADGSANFAALFVYHNRLHSMQIIDCQNGGDDCMIIVQEHLMVQTVRRHMFLACRSTFVFMVTV